MAFSSAVAMGGRRTDRHENRCGFSTVVHRCSSGRSSMGERPQAWRCYIPDIRGFVCLAFCRGCRIVIAATLGTELPVSYLN